MSTEDVRPAGEDAAREADRAARAKALIPPIGSEERDFWIEAAIQHGFEETVGGEILSEYDPPAFFATQEEVLALMASARQQGRDDAALASPRADSGEPHFGYFFHNPDTGHEWSESHPIESGEVEDAENVRPATLKTLHEELIEAWGALEDARADLYTPAPASEGVPASGSDVFKFAGQLVSEIDGLIETTDGIAGLHRNGDLATWEKLLPEGQYERLSSLDMLREALAAANTAGGPSLPAGAVPQGLTAEEWALAVKAAIGELRDTAASLPDRHDAQTPILAALGVLQAVEKLASHPAGQSAEDEPDDCGICDKPLIAGQRVMQDVELGTVHAACCGPEREAYVKDVETGEPLGPNDPIPQGYVYGLGQTAGQSTTPAADPTLIYWIESETERLCNLFPKAAASIVEFREELVGLMEGDPAGQSAGSGAGMRKRDGGQRIIDGSNDAVAFSQGDASRGRLLRVDGGRVVDAGPAPSDPEAGKMALKPAPNSPRTGGEGTESDTMFTSDGFSGDLIEVPRLSGIVRRDPAPNSPRTGGEGTEWALVPTRMDVGMIAAFWRRKNTGSDTPGEFGSDRSDAAAYRAMLAARPASHPAAPEAQGAWIVCDVLTMRLSDGRADYFTRIKCGDRDMTIFKFGERYKAQYSADEFAWLLGLRPGKPDLTAYDEASYPNEPAPPASSGQEA